MLLAETAVPVAPVRTPAQRLAALEKANATRVYRARLKEDIKAGRSERTVMDIISDPLPLEETWKVADLLLLPPGVWKIKRNQVLNRLHISMVKTVGGLSERQRLELVRWLWGLPSVSRGIVRS